MNKIDLPDIIFLRSIGVVKQATANPKTIAIRAKPIPEKRTEYFRHRREKFLALGLTCIGQKRIRKQTGLKCEDRKQYITEYSKLRRLKFYMAGLTCRGTPAKLRTKRDYDEERYSNVKQLLNASK